MSITQGRSCRAKPAKFITGLIAEKGSISGEEVSEEDLGTARTGKDKLKSGPKIKIKLPSASAENSGAPSTTTTTTTTSAHIWAAKVNESVTVKQGVSSKAPATGRVRDNKTEATCESTNVEDIVEVGVEQAGEKRSREDSNPRQKGANKSTTTKATDRPKKRMRRKYRTSAEVH
ncbi:hypothetical protein FRC00_001505 [Tulasnella sp. 408]|nr:hypothetical protein FRC00_001505 [Tulasnella sp. 408]